MRRILSKVILAGRVNSVVLAGNQGVREIAVPLAPLHVRRYFSGVREPNDHIEDTPSSALARDHVFFFMDRVDASSLAHEDRRLALRSLAEEQHRYSRYIDVRVSV